MARPNLFDHLQVFPFWLFDATIVQGVNLPVFSPLLGFTRISMPELSFEMEEIREGNWPFPTKVLKSGSISNMTLERGLTFYNSDFFNWGMAAILGDVFARRWFGINNAGLPVIGGLTVRRTLVLVQFFPRGTGAVDVLKFAVPDEFQQRVGGVVQSAGQAARNVASNIGPLEIIGQLATNAEDLIRVPARAWLLHGCLPTRVKPGGDLDASSSDVSIAEVEVAVEEVEEIMLSVEDFF